MNPISSRFSVCRRSSSLLRNNPFRRSSKPIFSSSSSKLITVFISKPHHHTFKYPSPPPQIPRYHFRKLSGEASQISNFGDDDHLKKEISEVQDEQWNALENVELGKIPPLDAVKDLADKFDALMEKLGFHYNEKEAWDDEDDDYVFLISHYGEFQEHLKRFKKDIRHLQTYADMTVAYGEFVAAGGEDLWYPFMSHHRRMLRGEINEEYGIFKEGKDERADENYRKILASLRQLKIRSRLMKRLIKAKSDSM